MTIKTLAAKGTSCAEIGRLLKLPESNVRYHLARLKREVIDGRSQRPRRALVVAEAIEHWMQTHRDRATNLTVLHDWLLAEHGYAGS
ncbi:MAG: hypothetical protein AB7U97_26755, partial [Pirellulales bacterium]